MTRNVEKAALATFTADFTTYEAPSSLHYDIGSFLALHTTNARTIYELS